MGIPAPVIPMQGSRLFWRKYLTRNRITEEDVRQARELHNLAVDLAEEGQEIIQGIQHMQIDIRDLAERMGIPVADDPPEQTWEPATGATQRLDGGYFGNAIRALEEAQYGTPEYFAALREVKRLGGG